MLRRSVSRLSLSFHVYLSLSGVAVTSITAYIKTLVLVVVLIILLSLYDFALLPEGIFCE